jgi:hypothetical protein
LHQVRPKLPLLKILQAAGAQGEMFTVKEVSHDRKFKSGLRKEVLLLRYFEGATFVFF